MSCVDETTKHLVFRYLRSWGKPFILNIRKTEQIGRLCQCHYSITLVVILYYTFTRYCQGRKCVKIYKNLYIVFLIIACTSIIILKSLIRKQQQQKQHKKSNLNQKAFGKIQHPFLIKSLRKLGIKRHFLNLIKIIKKSQRLTWYLMVREQMFPP